MRAIGLLVLLWVAPAAAQRPASAVALERCEVRGLDGEVRCGFLAVPETRDGPESRTIRLHVVVARARDSTHRAEDALLFIAGGPGQAASEMGPFATAGFGGLRERRDFLFVDVRGTGGSKPLGCRLYRTPADFFGSMYPPASVATCRDSLARGADLAAYTTIEIVEDLEAARLALGYPRLDLYGTSYGTRVALEYLRRHPGSIRAAVLKSTAPAAMRAPTWYAADGEVALRRLFRDCAADAGCAARGADLEGALRRLLERARAGELRIGLGPAGGNPADSIALRPDVVAGTLLGMLQSVHSAAAVPALVVAADGGRLEPLGAAILQYRRGIDQGLASGMHLSVMCSEDTALLDSAVAARAATGMLLRTGRVEAQLAACRGWPTRPVSPDYLRPVRTSVPTLFVSGELDPNTPPRWADTARREFARSWHVVLPNVAHAFSSIETCGAGWIREFIERASGANLDTRCAADLRRPPFRAP